MGIVQDYVILIHIVPAYTTLPARVFACGTCVGLLQCRELDEQESDGDDDSPVWEHEHRLQGTPLTREGPGQAQAQLSAHAKQHDDCIAGATHPYAADFPQRFKHLQTSMMIAIAGLGKSACAVLRILNVTM